MTKAQPTLDEVKDLQQQAQAKRLDLIKQLLEQRDEIDRQLTELDYRDIATPEPGEQEPRLPGKRVRSDQTKLRMAAQYWIRAGAKDPEGLAIALKKRRGLAKMIEQLKAEGSNGFSLRNKLQRG